MGRFRQLYPVRTAPIPTRLTHTSAKRVGGRYRSRDVGLANNIVVLIVSYSGLPHLILLVKSVASVCIWK